MGELRGNEVEDLELMVHFHSALTRCERENKRLCDRLGGIGKMENLTRARESLEDLLVTVKNTVQPETWDKLIHHVMMQELHLRNSKCAVDPDGDYIVVPTQALKEILFHCKEACLGCSMEENSAEKMRTCGLRKALKQMAVIDWKALESGGLCVGLEMKWDDIRG